MYSLARSKRQRMPGTPGQLRASLPINRHDARRDGVLIRRAGPDRVRTWRLVDPGSNNWRIHTALTREMRDRTLLPELRGAPRLVLGTGLHPVAARFDPEAPYRRARRPTAESSPLSREKCLFESDRAH